MFVSAPCLRRGGAFAARRTDGRQPIKCTICGDPAYIELRVGLVAALAPFPEARQAVAAVLHTIEGKAADAVRSETRELAHDGLAGQVNVWANERERKREQSKTRPSSKARGYDKDWQQFRIAFLRIRPRCCEPGCPLLATEVDHIRSVRERPDLRLDPSNCRSLCKSHHSARTAREQGFARRGEGGHCRCDRGES
jgi:5-methylcytosine-specific restriction protein A